jgi:hypothetical protein
MVVRADIGIVAGEKSKQAGKATRGCAHPIANKNLRRDPLSIAGIGVK